jgi:hypothetical protein
VTIDLNQLAGLRYQQEAKIARLEAELAVARCELESLETAVRLLQAAQPLAGARLKRLSVHEAYERALEASSLSYREAYKRLVDAGAIMLAEPAKAEYLVAGAWPTRNPGTRRERCFRCSAYVTVSPSSGIPALAENPSLKIICFECAQKIAAEELAP